MPKYARFDSAAPGSTPVLGWYDTDLLHYPELPPDADMLALSDDAWEARMGGAWVVENHALAPRPPEPAPLPHQAAQLLAGGLTVRCEADPSLDAVYPCDPASRARMAEAVAWLHAGHGFPDGATFNLTVTGGGHVTFTKPENFLGVALAMRAFAYACEEVMAGRNATLPNHIFTI